MISMIFVFIRNRSSSHLTENNHRTEVKLDSYNSAKLGSSDTRCSVSVNGTRTLR